MIEAKVYWRSDGLVRDIGRNVWTLNNSEKMAWELIFSSLVNPQPWEDQAWIVDQDAATSYELGQAGGRVSVVDPDSRIAMLIPFLFFPASATDWLAAV